MFEYEGNVYFVEVLWCVTQTPSDQHMSQKLFEIIRASEKEYFIYGTSSFLYRCVIEFI